jgi:hypothetical protein
MSRSYYLDWLRVLAMLTIFLYRNARFFNYEDWSVKNRQLDLDGGIEMSQTILYRIAAVALVVGAVLVTAGNLLAPQGDDRAAVESLLYYPLALVVLLGGLLIMAGWTAVYLRQRAESGVLGFVGFVAVLAAGMLLLVGFPLIQVLIFPWIATMHVSTATLSDGPASFTVFFAVASAIVSLGGVLFGVATIRARIFSRPLGIGIIVLAAASFVLGFLSIPGGGGIHMSWWWATTGTFGVVAYMVVMAWFGIELFQSVGVGRFQASAEPTPAADA